VFVCVDYLGLGQCQSQNQNHLINVEAANLIPSQARGHHHHLDHGQEAEVQEGEGHVRIHLVVNHHTEVVDIHHLDDLSEEIHLHQDGDLQDDVDH